MSADEGASHRSGPEGHDGSRQPSGAGFGDPAVVDSYVGRTRRAVPGLDVVHGLVDQILTETTPDGGRILVIGAGGGLEIRHLADRHPNWTFDGVDPSPQMLDLARRTIGSHMERVTLHDGDVRRAPQGPFDAATCLLTLHFLDTDERLATLGEIRRRLRPGAPLLTFHHTAADGPDPLTWFRRYARFAADPASGPAEIERSAAAMATRLPVLRPHEDEALLRDAGFRDIGLFFAALTFRGWVASASPTSTGRGR